MHWGVLLYELDEKWWAKGAGTRLISAMASSLGKRSLAPELLASIKWTHDKVGLPAPHQPYSPFDEAQAGSTDASMYYMPGNSASY